MHENEPADPTHARQRDRGDTPRPEHGSAGALAFMAHELRTPLTAIIGISDLLHDSPLSADQRDMLEILGRSARALVEIVNGVLDLEKLEAGKLQLERRTFSPDDCVEECVNLFAATAAQKRIDLAFHVDDAVPSLIQGDPARLRQTLINLVGNAIKFTERGHIILTVTATTGPDGAGQVRFTIADSGPGIPDEIRGRIFEPYAQAEASTSRRYGGTGLGLPIARRLVALMGGTLDVESEVGRGATFTFSLPTDREAAAGVRPRTPEPGLAGKRIVVVEDDAAVGALLVRTLARWEARATVVPDLSSAVAALRDAGADAVLVDADAPSVSGRASVLGLRATPGCLDLPIIIMSAIGAADGAPGPGETLRDLRLMAHVTKPVRPARLLDALRHAMVVGPAPGAERAGPERGRDSRATAGRLGGVSVLLVEDDADLRSALARSLALVGAEVRTAVHGAEALAMAAADPVDVVLLDASLPGVNSFEVCRRLKAEPATRLVPVIMMAGADTAEDRQRVVDAGADAIVCKPFAREELLARVRSAARMKRVTDGLDPEGAALVLLARLVEGRDPDTLGHLERISDLGGRLAERVGMDETEVAAVRLSGLVHDVGKSTLPDTILAKPDTLDAREWELMRTHPVEGERLCADVDALRAALPAIRHHHERRDGSGYPDGLRGNAIPAAARVLQVVDVYDALTTPRSYRRAESPEGALEILAREAERGWWDPQVLAAFRELIRADLQGRRGFGIPRH